MEGFFHVLEGHTQQTCFRPEPCFVIPASPADLDLYPASSGLPVISSVFMLENARIWIGT